MNLLHNTTLEVALMCRQTPPLQSLRGEHERAARVHLSNSGGEGSDDTLISVETQGLAETGA